MMDLLAQSTNFKRSKISVFMRTKDKQTLTQDTNDLTQLDQA